MQQNHEGTRSSREHLCLPIKRQDVQKLSFHVVHGLLELRNHLRHVERAVARRERLQLADGVAKVLASFGSGRRVLFGDADNRGGGNEKV